MRTPREIAHDGVREGMAWCTHDSYDPAFNRHSSACDRLTAALEARDAEHAIAWDGLMAWQQWVGLLEPGSPNGDEPRRERIAARLAERDSARAEVNRLREALERIAKEECAFTGSFENCEEAKKCGELLEEQDWCSGCIARRALSPATPVPALPATYRCPACSRIFRESELIRKMTADLCPTCNYVVINRDGGPLDANLVSDATPPALPVSMPDPAAEVELLKAAIRLQPGDALGAEGTVIRRDVSNGFFGFWLDSGGFVSLQNSVICLRRALASPTSEGGSAGSLPSQHLPAEQRQTCELCHGVGLVRPRFNRGTLQDCPRGCKGTVTKGGTP